MQTNREDVGIAIRSAFLQKGTQQRFSIFILVTLSIILLFVETIESKPLNLIRSFIKDTIYRGSMVISAPTKGIGNSFQALYDHMIYYEDYTQLKEENKKLKERVSKTDFLSLENQQLRKLVDERTKTYSNLVSSRVVLDKQSPYLNSFIINTGTNKNIKNGMAVLDGSNFIGRIVDVNFFSSRVLLISDLNSRIPVVVEPSGTHAILVGRGNDFPVLEYLPKNHLIEPNYKVYTSGKEGIFSPGISIGATKIEEDKIVVSLFSDLGQITFANVIIGEVSNKK
tara:strand:- start:95 stop:943 length:849 start_codon:yes stop_codon:yes gene_type:complete